MSAMCLPASVGSIVTRHLGQPCSPSAQRLSCVARCLIPVDAAGGASSTPCWNRATHLHACHTGSPLSATAIVYTCVLITASFLLCSLDTSVKTQVREQSTTEMKHFLFSWPGREILYLLGPLRMISVPSEFEPGMLTYTCRDSRSWGGRILSWRIAYVMTQRKKEKLSENFPTLCLKIVLKWSREHSWYKYGEEIRVVIWRKEIKYTYWY